MDDRIFLVCDGYGDAMQRVLCELTGCHGLHVGHCGKAAAYGLPSNTKVSRVSIKAMVDVGFRRGMSTLVLRSVSRFPCRGYTTKRAKVYFTHILI